MTDLQHFAQRPNAQYSPSTMYLLL